MPKMVNIHETTFEHLNEVKISLDKIITEAEIVREYEKKKGTRESDYAALGMKVVEILKEYLGDEW